MAPQKIKLAILASTFLVGEVLAQNVSSQCRELFDVGIVGGGLSGLSAAKHLTAAGLNVIVIEARNRVGGRVLNRALSNGGVQEMGAEFIGPTQDRMYALAAELGLQLYDEYNTGSNIFYYNGTRTRYGTDANPPVDISSLVQVADSISKIDSMAAEIDVNAPWKHPKAKEWDSQTYASWLDTTTPLPGARLLQDVACTSIFSAEPAELSLLYVISYIAAGGNATTKGQLERFVATGGGAQQARVVGGTQLFAIELAKRLGPKRIALGHPVRRIERSGNSYVITADDLITCAKKVVVAMSPPLAARIQYHPILPPHRDQLTQRMPMASVGKAIAIYKTPFWRAENLTGQAVSDTGAGRVTFDNSPMNASYGALMSFVEADDMREWDTASEAALKRRVLQDYVNFFGPQAWNATDFVMQRWNSEEWSRGGPVAIAPPGVLTRYGPALRDPFEGIHFAGTETADYWVGYMDGAVRSGERVANEIVQSFRQSGRGLLSGNGELPFYQ